MKLYFSPGACSLAPHIVLEELGTPYETAAVPILEGANLAPGYEKVHPLRRVPVLEVDGRRLTEAAAILGYLADTHPDAGLLPRDPWARARAAEWFGFLASSVHIGFAQTWRGARFSADEAHHASVARRGRENLLEHFAILEARLGDAPWALGDAYSVVDPYLFVFHRWAPRVDIDLGPYERWNAHARRVLARPATARALAAEGLA